MENTEQQSERLKQEREREQSDHDLLVEIRVTVANIQRQFDASRIEQLRTNDDFGKRIGSCEKYMIGQEGKASQNSFYLAFFLSLAGIILGILRFIK